MNKRFSITVVTGQGGGGHYATYQAIRAIVEQQERPWSINILNVDTFIERLAEHRNIIDIYRLFGTTGDEVINQAQQNNWKFLQKLTMPLNKMLVKLNYPVGVSMTEAEWRKQQPDLVVSVVPLYNKVAWESLQRVKPGTPLVTVLTDFADCPPSFWMEPDTSHYVVCGTEKAVEQARCIGIKETQIISTSGMVVHPRFYEPMLCDRRHERQHLGLDPDCLTGVVLFGGCGSREMVDIAKRLECFGQKLQLIFLCGRNEEVAAMLREQSTIQKKFVTNFTSEVPYYMYLADFFIGKPGPGSISEALVMKLPVIVQSNANTLPQEQHNAVWIQQQQVGLVIPNFSHVQTAVEQFLNPEIFAHYRTHVAAIDNRAVFEVSDLIQHFLTNSVAEPGQLSHNNARSFPTNNTLLV